VTPLDSIEIYTTGNNVRLHEVLQKMKESSTKRPDVKGNQDTIRKYFLEVYPDMDEERVYTSDMKKMLKWYDILEGADLLDFSAMNEEAATEEAGGLPAEGAAQVAESTKKGGDTAEAALVEEGEEKPAKKARAKKAAATEEDGEEKPAKKTAAKKKSAEGAEGEAAPKKAAKAKKTEE
jgi:hypothetical protein